MDSFSHISLLHPEVLALLLLLPVLWGYYRWQLPKRYPRLRLSTVEGLAAGQSWRSRLRPIVYVLRALAFALLIVAMARPQTTLKEEEITAEGIDIVLVIDLSSSMLSEDFTPNRLEASKAVAREFVGKRPYDRMGLVVFAGEAFTQSPLTTDHRVVDAFLADLSCGLLEDGTAIGMGLATAVNRLKDSEAETKVVVLLTDGVNNAGYIKPMTAAEIASELGVRVYTIGVGTIGQARSPVGRRNDGSYVFKMAQVVIDTELLKTIARMTGGQYYRATNPESLQQIYDEIDQLEKTEMEITTIERYSEEFHLFALAAILLLAMELLLRLAVFRSWP